MSKGFYWKPHGDEPGFDRIVVSSIKPIAGINRIELSARERYKTSGLSGDEWRFSWSLGATGPGHSEPIRTGCGFFDDVGLALIPRVLEGAIQERGWSGLFDSADGDATIEVYRRGVLCNGRRFSNLIAATMNVAWWARVYGEQSEFDASASRTIYTGYCAQPGCPEKAEVVYQLKKEFDSWGREIEELSIGPARRCFCLKHARRGDCGLEDADANYLVISAPDGFDQQTCRVDPAKVTQSGCIVLRDEGTPKP